MSRGDLTDCQWERLQPHLPKQTTGKRGGQWKDHRTVINGILWIVRTGAPWRDLPERYGPWQTCYDRFVRWQQNGLWTHLLQALQQEADAQENVEWDGCAVDSVTIKAHPQAAGALRDPAPTQGGEKGGTQANQKFLKPPARRKLRKRPLRLLPTPRLWAAVGEDFLPKSI